MTQSTMSQTTLQAHPTGLATGIIAGLHAFLLEIGVDPRDVFHAAGIAYVEQWSTETVPMPEVAALLEAAAALTSDPDFGLHFASTVEPGATGLFGLLQMTAPTVRDLMTVTVEYSELSFENFNLHWDNLDNGSGVFTGRMPPGYKAQLRQLPDLLLAILVDRIRLGAGPLWHPPAVSVETPRPDDDKMYKTYFGPHIEFSAGQYEIFIERECLDKPIAQTLGGLRENIRPQADLKLRELRASMSIAETVKRRIMKQLGGDEQVGLESIARDFSLTARALQWRLEREDTTFETLLGDVREQLAITELSNPSRTMAEISASLGFSEPSAFTRWAGRRFGAPPTEVRRQLLAHSNGG